MARSKAPSRKGGRAPIPRATEHYGAGRLTGYKRRFDFRRRYPLRDSDFEAILSSVQATLRENRRKFRWYFVSVRLKVLGGLYQVRLIPTDEDDAKWEEQWVATPVSSDMRDLRGNLETLLEDTIDTNLRGRPAWVLGFQVNMFRNKR